MKSEQLIWGEGSGWDNKAELKDAELVLVFGDGEFFASSVCFDELKKFYPKAEIVGCSSAGHIGSNRYIQTGVVATALKFDKTGFKVACSSVTCADDSYEAAKNISLQLMKEGLKHILVLTEGLNVNGSELSRGFNEHAKGVSVSGGHAGDGGRFKQTLVICNDAPKSNIVVGVGFYGDVSVKVGCNTGWDEFGADRVVTKSKGNVVYEIDGKPALELYKKYLGDEAAALPASGLFFPISVKESGSDHYIIRTLLGVNEEEQSLTFAGDVAQGSICKLMKSNINKLIDFSQKAAEDAKSEIKTGLGIIVSCIGRQMVLGQLVDEEIEAVAETLGDGVALTGFYSYGELAPLMGLAKCELHNQSVVVTAIYE